MEIKINVDEIKFKDVLENELNAFSKEELHEIIRECIIEVLHNDNTIKNLFIVEKKDSWGYSVAKEPSEVMIQAAKSIDLSPAYKEIQDSMINKLKEDYQWLLEKTLLNLIKEGLTGEWQFRERLADEVSYILSNRQCNN